MTKYRIPVRVVTPPVTARRTHRAEADPSRIAPEKQQPAREQAEETAQRAVSSAADNTKVDEALPEQYSVPQDKAHPPREPSLQGLAQSEPATKEREPAYRSSEKETWRERALRLQAEMATYRRRQQRIAQEEARQQQIDLLNDALTVADNLDRTVAAGRGQSKAEGNCEPLMKGVELTLLTLERILAKHGLERIEVEGQPFDPAWHEAIHTVSASSLDAEPGTVVKVLEAGYRRQGKLFRPAKVVVAQ